MYNRLNKLIKQTLNEKTRGYSQWCCCAGQCQYVTRQTRFKCTDVWGPQGGARCTSLGYNVHCRRNGEPCLQGNPGSFTCPQGHQNFLTQINNVFTLQNGMPYPSVERFCTHCNTNNPNVAGSNLCTCCGGVSPTIQESKLRNIIKRTLSEQTTDMWACINNTCTPVELGPFATEGECEDSMCGDRRRPTDRDTDRGDKMSAMDTQAVTEVDVSKDRLGNEFCMCNGERFDLNIDGNCRHLSGCEEDNRGRTTKGSDIRRMSAMDTEALNEERKLRKIIKRTLNESELLLERPECSAQYNNPYTGENVAQCGKGKTCARAEYSWEMECQDMNRTMGFVEPTGGSDDDCCLFWNAVGDFCVERDPDCEDDATVKPLGPGQVVPFKVRGIPMESKIKNLIHKVINERRDTDVEAETGKTYVCVKGGCYDWDKTSDAVQCEGYGGQGDTEYPCFNSKRKCKKNC